MRDDKLHAKRKAQMQMGYTGKENIGLEASIDVQVKNFIDLVRRKYVSTAEETKAMDLASKVSLLWLLESETIMVLSQRGSAAL